MDILLDIIRAIDYDILLLIAKHWRGGFSDIIWTAISSLGNYGAFWIALALLLLVFRKTRRAGFAILTALLLSFLICNLGIKEWVMRPRPFITHHNLTALFDPGDKWSFPSAHTVCAFSSASALCFYHRKSSIAAYLLAVCIAFSRLYASVHYPTDVIAGVVIGLLIGFAAGWLTDHAIDLFHYIRLRKGNE